MGLMSWFGYPIRGQLSRVAARGGIARASDWRVREEKRRQRKINKTRHRTNFQQAVTARILGNVTVSSTMRPELLQVVTLLATRARKVSWAGPSGDAPEVSCKRKDIRRLTRDEYREWAHAAEGFVWAAGFLAREGIFTARDVPYRTQLVPLAAIRATLGEQIDNHGTIARIRQWYWSGVLGELYGSAGRAPPRPGLNVL